MTRDKQGMRYVPFISLSFLDIYGRGPLFMLYPQRLYPSKKLTDGLGRALELIRPWFHNIQLLHLQLNLLSFLTFNEEAF